LISYYSLFTDGRYFLQAEKQLDGNWSLMRQGQPGTLSFPCLSLFSLAQHLVVSQTFLRGKSFCLNFLKVLAWAWILRLSVFVSLRGIIICVRTTDSSHKCVSADAKDIKSSLEKRKSTLVSIRKNLVDLVWGAEKPKRPTNPVIVHGIKFAGQPFEEKISSLQKAVEKQNGRAFIVTALDEIACKERRLLRKSFLLS
jgi:Xaa-Pro aminopeptidase